MSQVTNETVIECLKTIKGPNLEGDIVSLGMVSPIMIDGGKVIFNHGAIGSNGKAGTDAPCSSKSC
jgi:metal-sulfur cluster biosynthetic enzyme